MKFKKLLIATMATAMIIGGTSIAANATSLIDTAWVKSDSNWYYYDESGAMKTGWLRYNNNWYYLNTNGTMAVGHKTIDGKRFYFNDDGSMFTGWKLTEYGYWTYYRDNGAMAVGWASINGKTYYFDVDGYMIVGLRTISSGGVSRTYFFDYSGALQRNKFSMTIDGTWVYSDETGAILKNQTITVNGQTYALGPSGAMIRNSYFYDSADAVDRYFGSDGRMCTGFVYDYYGDLIYINSDGVISFDESWVKVGNDWYYVEAYGEVLHDDMFYLDDATYLFDQDGKMQKSRWYYDNWHNDWYYFDANGKMAIGWRLISGKYYYFEEDGVMIFNTIYDIGDDTYCFDANGVMQSGWFRYYGNWFHADSNGALSDGITVVNGKTYAFANGYMIRGYYYDKYFDPDTGEMFTGWFYNGYVWKYYDPATGNYVTDWNRMNGHWYFFNSSGTLLTGFQTIEDATYYFSPSGEMQVGWVKFGGAWFYFGPNGQMRTGWQKIDNKWYFFRSNGTYDSAVQR